MHCVPSTKFSGADTPGHQTTTEGDLTPILGMLMDYRLIEIFFIFEIFPVAVLDLVRTVQGETGGAKIEGHAVDPGPVPIPDHLHVRIAGRIPGLALFPHVGLIPDHLDLLLLQINNPRLLSYNGLL